LACEDNLVAEAIFLTAFLHPTPHGNMSDVPPFPHSMLALQYSHFRGSINIVTIDVPQPGDDDCVIKVIAAGLCRSDWHGWLGHDPDISSFPHTPGHEFAGEVHAVGRYDIICMNLLTNSPLNRCGEGRCVQRVRVGDRVTVPFVCGCGKCSLCCSGNAQVCEQQWQPGFHGQGCWAQFVRVPQVVVLVWW